MLAVGDVERGLVEICQMGAMFLPGERVREGLLLRPTKPGELLHKIERQMSYAEWLSTSAGMPFDSDRQFARHNVLATELGLRMAEFGNVGTALGEKLSSMAMLAYTGVRDPVPTTGTAGGSDLTLVRTDGLRIAVEVTASVHGGWFSEKVERLVRILHHRPLARTGLCVLFVVAPRRETVSQAPREVLRKVSRTSKRQCGLTQESTPIRPLRASASSVGRNSFPTASTRLLTSVNSRLNAPPGPATSAIPAERTYGTGHTSSTLSPCRSPPRIHR